MGDDGFLVASICQHSGPAWSAIRFKSLEDCKKLLDNVFEDLAGEAANIREVTRIANLANAMSEITETNFGAGNCSFICEIGHEKYMLADVALLKEENIFKFDQFIKIKRDHFDCGVIEDKCKYEDGGPSWHTNM